MMPGSVEPSKFILLGIIAVVVIYLLSGFYFVQPSEHSVVTTFGKYSKTVEQPGLKWHTPYPFQSNEIVNVTNERRVQVGFRSFATSNSNSGVQDVEDESLMLTGDENIIDIDFVVLWRISDAANYIFNIRDPEATIKIVAESAMREIIGQTNIQPALTQARGEIQSATRELMQRMLDEYEAGVNVNIVQLQKVDPPQPVIDAFNEVQRARQQKEQLRNQAEAYRNDIIPRARGESEKMRQQAEAYKEEVVNQAKGDAQRFVSVYNAYTKGRDVTAERMYLETLEDVLNNANTIILDGNSGSGTVPYLSLNELRTPSSSRSSPQSTEQTGQ
ncbi:MAG: FtsH protease activity modulator HflK [Alphaproteobacteria bacterium]|nr:FtsH protease activity modulator HflK [Alphaproteobacteria bacterium]